MASDINGKTVHLRAHIHCEGCKKKVKKILSKIEGVDTVEIEASIGKVTVTGTADAKTLMKKLEKCGKVVQLWPAPPQPTKVISPALLPKKEMKPAAKEKDMGEKVGEPQASSEKAAPPGSTITLVTPNTCRGSPSEKKSKEAEKKKSEDAAAPVTPSVVKGGDKQSSGKAESKSSPQNSKVKGNADAKQAHDGAATVENKKVGGSGVATPNSSSGKASEDSGKEGHSPDRQEAPSTAGKRRNNGNGSGSGSGGGENEEEWRLSDDVATTSTASKHRAPPPMVLVETSNYSSADMEFAQADYATHMFSDENANNCTLM